MRELNLFKSLGLALGCATLLFTTNSIAASEHSLTLNGDFDTTIQVLPPFPSFPPEPLQPILHLLITATGNLSHFGRVTAATTDQAVDLSLNPNHGTAHWVFQTPEGDALVTEMDLSGTPLDAIGNTEFHGTLTVLSGSGKFAGASGDLQFQGGAQGNTGFVSVEGTVTLVRGEKEQ